MWNYQSLRSHMIYIYTYIIVIDIIWIIYIMWYIYHKILPYIPIHSEVCWSKIAFLPGFRTAKPALHWQSAASTAPEGALGTWGHRSTEGMILWENHLQHTLRGFSWKNNLKLRIFRIERLLWRNSTGETPFKWWMCSRGWTPHKVEPRSSRPPCPGNSENPPSNPMNRIFLPCKIRFVHCHVGQGLP